MKIFLGIVGAVAALFLLIGLIVGGWKLYWVANTSATNHSDQIYQRSYGTQTADINEVRQLIPQINTSTGGQKTALINQACGLVNEITPPLPSDIQIFSLQKNCIGR